MPDGFSQAFAAQAGNEMKHAFSTGAAVSGADLLFARSAGFTDLFSMGHGLALSQRGNTLAAIYWGEPGRGNGTPLALADNNEPGCQAE